MKSFIIKSAIILLIFIMPAYGVSQKQKKNSASAVPAQVAEVTVPAISFDTTLLGSMSYRLIGPFRGGRSCTVTGIKGNTNIYYMGSTGGGAVSYTHLDVYKRQVNKSVWYR